VSYETGIAELEKLVLASDAATDLPPLAGEEIRSVFGDYSEHVLAEVTVLEPRLKLAADAANGMGTIYLPILERLNVDLVPLYFELDGTFPNHEANPLKHENLVDAERAVSENGCDLGVAFDGDADRAILIDEQGRYISADKITGLLAPRFLRSEPGATIVYDLRSSWATKEAIEEAGGVPLRDWPGWDRAQEPALANKVRRAAYEVIQRKGFTNHAIGLVTAQLLRSMLRGDQRVLTVSRVQDGAMGLHGVALSLPTVVGRQGGSHVVEPQMDDAERAALLRSAQLLRDARASIGTD